MYFVKTNTIDFSKDSNFSIYKIDGLCPPSAALNFSTIANVDGKVYNSGRINERNIVLYIKINQDLNINRTVEINRNILYGHFPVGQKVRIFYRNEMHDVYIDGYVESFECDFFVNNEIAQISIICNDPYFRSLEKQSVSMSIVNNMFEFPFSIPVDNPIVISDRNYYVTGKINPGLVATGIIVEFEAIGDGVLHPWLTNSTTHQTMKLSGRESVLNAGEKIIVNTNKHNLSITKILVDGTSKNILNTMDTGFQWVQLAPGDNYITFGTDAYPENMVVNVSFEKLLLGV